MNNKPVHEIRLGSVKARCSVESSNRRIGRAISKKAAPEVVVKKPLNKKLR
jgi:hypothetical protein